MMTPLCYLVFLVFLPRLSIEFPLPVPGRMKIVSVTLCGVESLVCTSCQGNNVLYGELSRSIRNHGRSLALIITESQQSHNASVRP